MWKPGANRNFIYIQTDVEQRPQPRTNRTIAAQMISAQKDLAKIQHNRAGFPYPELKNYRADFFHRAAVHYTELKVSRADISCTDIPRSLFHSGSSGIRRHRLTWPHRTLAAHTATPSYAATAFPRRQRPNEAWPHIDWDGPTILRPTEHG